MLLFISYKILKHPHCNAGNTQYPTSRLTVFTKIKYWLAGLVDVFMLIGPNTILQTPRTNDFTRLFCRKMT
jgi:hypothetical protein